MSGRQVSSYLRDSEDSISEIVTKRQTNDPKDKGEVCMDMNNNRSTLKTLTS